MSRFVAKDYPTRLQQRRWGVWDSEHDAWVRCELGSVRKFATQIGARSAALWLNAAREPRRPESGRARHHGLQATPSASVAALC
ncbi:MAG TPA: hypothetical protein VHL98_11515 [Microvirga sp.]|jgi:hypothetical protein|nr:hypothetical protein [Microvirga sp.]